MTDPASRRVVVNETPGRGWGLGPADTSARRDRPPRATALIATAILGLALLTGILTRAWPTERPDRSRVSTPTGSAYLHPAWDFRFVEENIASDSGAFVRHNGTDAATIRFLEENLQPPDGAGE